MRKSLLTTLAAICIAGSTYGQSLRSTRWSPPTTLAVDEEETPVAFREPEIDQEKGNALTILTRGYYNKIMGAYKGGPDLLTKRVDTQYNNYLALVDHPTEFIQAFDLARDRIGKLDFLYIPAHGSPAAIMLSEDHTLRTTQIQELDLSSYFNEGARGVIAACSTASDTLEDNFSQVLADITKIPIEGSSVDGGAYITEDLHLEDYQTRHAGFNPKEGTGIFESSDGVNYIIKQEQGSYRVVGHSLNMYGHNKRGTNKIPADFDPDKVYYTIHGATRAPIRIRLPR